MQSKCSSKGENLGAAGWRLPDGSTETPPSRQDDSDSLGLGPPTEKRPPPSCVHTFHAIKKRKSIFSNYVNDSNPQ